MNWLIDHQVILFIIGMVCFSIAMISALGTS